MGAIAGFCGALLPNCLRVCRTVDSEDFNIYQGESAADGRMADSACPVGMCRGKTFEI